jgi:hypothetical protein
MARLVKLYCETTPVHALVLLSALIAADPAPAELPARATEFVRTLSRDDFAAAVKDFDDTLAKVLPADRLKTVWQGVTGRFGAFKEATDTRVEQRGKLTIVYVVSKFEKAPLDVRVVFDSDKKVSGLQFLPPARARSPPSCSCTVRGRTTGTNRSARTNRSATWPAGWRRVASRSSATKNGLASTVRR